MIEEPLDRLNYYNGQRLDASDLKLEQQYHIRVRRWINKSLYTPGIASGLDVRAETNTRFVVVGPGMALDAEGREILLLEEERIFVPGSSSATGSFANPQGLYLTIRYDEEPIQEEDNQCVPQGKNGRNGNHASWGGPALLRAKPLFNWSDALPYDSSGEVVLAQVALDSTCTYAIVNPGVRRYVGEASAAKVYQYALEGEKNVDKNNPGQIYFHVRGREPKAVTLYLKAGLFSTLYYTELGNHTHQLGVKGTIGGPVDSVQQPMPSTTGENGALHTHSRFTAAFTAHTGTKDEFFMLGPVKFLEGVKIGPVNLEIDIGGPPNYGDILSVLQSTTPQTNSDDGNPYVPQIGGATDHTHKHDHTHLFNFDSGNSGIGPAGVSDATARSGTNIKALTYVDDLKVEIDGHDVTKDIVNQLRNADPRWSALTVQDSKLGNGGGGHPFVENTNGDLTGHGGTGEIKLDFLPGITFLEGEHLIELSVSGDGNGGRILYNLYVE
jgi:hypothetical protein